MINSTSITYQMKRKILSFTNKISRHLSKPDGCKFESLGIVRDGSESTSAKNVYKKGYHVTEACVLTRINHPVSIFPRIHSSSEKDYQSVNTIIFQAMEQGLHSLEEQSFVWTAVMMITKCS